MGLGFSHLPFTHKASILNLFLLNPLTTRLTCFPESSVVPCLYTKALYWPNKLTHNAVSSERRERERVNPGLAVLTPYWFSTQQRPWLTQNKGVNPSLSTCERHSAAGVRDLVMEVTKLMFCLLLLPITFSHCLTTKLTLSKKCV